jgi:hypothetical protein
METVEIGQTVSLPHGEPVKVEFVYDHAKSGFYASRENKPVRLHSVASQAFNHSQKILRKYSQKIFSENIDMPSDR